METAMATWYEKMKAEVLGKSYDVDGYYGAQCWDFVNYVFKNYYYGSVIHCGITGYVKDIANQKSTNGILNFMTDIGLNTILKPGDVCIWGNCTACPDSHIAIYDHDDNKGNVYFLGQNQGATYVNVIKISTAGIIGCFRPKKTTLSDDVTKTTTTTSKIVVEPDPIEVKHGWKYEGSDWYYYTNGKKDTGWKKDNGTWYYLSDNGKMQTGWLNINTRWYWLGQNGAMRIGWHYIDGYWYYFEMANGGSGEMITGWKCLDDKWFYFNSKGHMLKGWHNLRDDNGVEEEYYFDNDGVWIKGKSNYTG